MLSLCEEFKHRVIYWKLDEGKSPKKNHCMKSYTIARTLQSRAFSCVVFVGFKNQFSCSMDCGFSLRWNECLWPTLIWHYVPSYVGTHFWRKTLLPSSLYEVTPTRLHSFMTHTTTVWTHSYYLYHNRFLSHMGSVMGVVEFVECRHVVRSRGFGTLSIANWFNWVAALHWC